MEELAIVHQERKNVDEPQNCNHLAAPQMCERGLRSVLVAHEQADDKAEVVLLNGYEELSASGCDSCPMVKM